MGLTPYIMFDGKCEEAFSFYANALGGEIKHLSRYEGSPMDVTTDNKNKVMHATFAAKDIVIMGADDTDAGPQSGKNSSIHLSLDFETAAEEEKVFNALGEGGKITLPLQDTFWGARFGMLQDKFGINWMFNCENKK